MEDVNSTIKALMAEKKYSDAVDLLEKEIRTHKAEGEKDRAYYTLLNNYTRACLGQFDETGDEAYFGKFQKVYLEMMDSQREVRATKFDISRYRKAYYKRYHRSDKE